MIPQPPSWIWLFLAVLAASLLVRLAIAGWMQ
jgi:hypothetical protein